MQGTRLPVFFGVESALAPDPRFVPLDGDAGAAAGPVFPSDDGHHVAGVAALRAGWVFGAEVLDLSGGKARRIRGAENERRACSGMEGVTPRRVNAVCAGDGWKSAVCACGRGGTAPLGMAWPSRGSRARATSLDPRLQRAEPGKLYDLPQTHVHPVPRGHCKGKRAGHDRARLVNTTCCFKQGVSTRLGSLV